MSDWTKLEEAVNLLEIIADNGGGGGGGGGDVNITQIDGTTVSKNSGNKDNGTIRVVNATDDPNLSALVKNTTLEPRTDSTYKYALIGGRSSAIPFAGMQEMFTADIPSVPVCFGVHVFRYDGANDGPGGNNAQSVFIEWVDSSNVTHSMTETLGDDTLLEDVRQIKQFYCNSWGVTKFNNDYLILMDTDNSYVCAIIEPNWNFMQRFQFEIPLNGTVWLDNLVAASYESNNSNQHMQVWILVRSYNGTDIIDQRIFGGEAMYQSSNTWDLSHFPPIQGPVLPYTTNISILPVASEIGGGQYDTYGGCYLSLKYTE